MTHPIRTGPPLLLTPGPLTTAAATRQAMNRDWGSRGADFLALSARVRARLTALVEDAEGHTTIPLQGSGTFAVEAMIDSFVPQGGGVLILENGAYGRRMADICRIHGRRHEVLSWPEDAPPPFDQIEAALEENPGLGHVAVVHVETTSGILNPITDIAACVARHQRRLLIDAMSAFGAIKINARSTPFEALAGSANKCLEGVPGIAFVVANKAAIKGAQGNAGTLSLDLFDQWRGLEATGEWRFTPPTHVVAALDAALDGLEAEGGIEARRGRYQRNCDVLRAGMRKLGFETYLADALQAPIIVTFIAPDDARFDFARFYDGLYERGFAIYPGKLTARPSFRIGCIGQVQPEDMEGVVQAAQETLRIMGLTLHPKMP